MNVTYEMKAWIPPIVTLPSCACRPPYQAMPPTANAVMSCTIGRNRAESQAARKPARYISPVSSPNSVRLVSSRPRDFTTRTPLMFSAYAPVTLEFNLRTCRYSVNTLRLNRAAVSTSTGTIPNTTSASRQLM